MSHKATNWAVEQRGIRPAAKVVLWHLADRHNPDRGGAFPSQDRLAHDCEMSRSALNENLKVLEQAGLVRRVQSRDPKTKQQNVTKYLLGFEFADEPQDVVSPCPESGHGNEPESVSGSAEKPCPVSGESRVRNPDTNPVREPVSKPVNERESAQARSDDGSEGTQDVDAPDTDDPKLFAKRVKRLEMGANRDPWPGALGSSTDWAIRQFAKLTDEQRRKAEERRDAYLAECARTKTPPVAIGVYFRDCKFDDVAEAAADDGQAMPDDYAKPFGPAWSAWRIANLLAGPDNPAAPEHQPSKRFQRVWMFQAPAAQGRGRRVGECWHGLRDAMEPVPTDSDAFEAWRAEHDARGWPRLPDHDGMRAIWFPKGGPEALDEFEAAVKAAKQASEGKAA